MQHFRLVHFILICLFTFVNINNLISQSFNSDPSILRDPTGYKIRTGDRIRITIQGQSDCSVDATVNQDGKVSAVYVGELKVSGLNVQSVESLITRKYQTELIFRNPVVRVFVTNYSERVVFLTGSVNRKGPYKFPPEVEAMNIVEVIARAGGFNDIAKKDKVYVTRTIYNLNGDAIKTETYTVNVEALSKGLIKFGNNKTFWIYPGDRIEVPERLI